MLVKTVKDSDPFSVGDLFFLRSGLALADAIKAHLEGNKADVGIPKNPDLCMTVSCGQGTRGGKGYRC